MLEEEKITPERAELLRSWVHSGFQVNGERRVEAGDRKGLESLLAYMERSPVSLERLTEARPCLKDRAESRREARGPREKHPGGRPHQSAGRPGDPSQPGRDRRR